MTKEFRQARAAVWAQAPLIHCITNPISINDCANAVLALGAKPVMAEHPAEAAGITAVANALAVNLGNITDARAESIFISGKAALENRIASVIDLVGVACSSFRLELAKKYIALCRPAVIKGNISEIKSAAGQKNFAAGIDVGGRDAVTKENTGLRQSSMELVKDYAKQTGAVVVASGEVDLISDGRNSFFAENGTADMARVTGTGCMLNVIIGTYLAVTNPLTAALLSVATLGVCGERADAGHGMGTYRVGLMDALSTLTDEQLEAAARLTPADL